MLQLIKIKFNKETKEEEFAPLHLRDDDIICLYQDRRGVFIVTKQGFMHKVPYKMNILKEVLEI
jgi:hypothetical protein